MGTAGAYAVLGTNITSTLDTVLNGDLGVSPGSSISGFPPGVVNGTTYAGDSQAAQAESDLVVAYNDAAGLTSTTTITGDQGGKTFYPGVYYDGAAFALTGTLKLDAQGNPNAVFVIQVNAALNTTASSTVQLINGAQASNVFWQVNGAAGTGASSFFTGTILAAGAITIGGAGTLAGRALSFGAVTLADNTITTPPGSPTATITSPTTGHTYGVGQVVSTHFTCADPTGPGITTCVDSDGSTTPGALSTTTTGTFVYTVTATSSDGQTGSTTISYTVAGIPTATITSPTTGHTYGVGQVVPTHFTCADPTGPGVTTCIDSDGSSTPGALSTTTPGTFVYTVTATSSDGQTGSATISYTVAGAPTASITSPTTGHTYGVGQVVSTHFTCADPTGPGITTCVDSDGATSPGDLSTTTTGTFVYTVTATSSDGQTGSTSISYTVAGAPTASITSPTSGQTYGVGQVVSTHFTCADPTGPGITTCVDSDGATSPGDLSTTTTGTYVYMVTATSSDGQTGSSTIDYSVAAQPTASITSPTTGHTYGVGQVVPTHFTCADPTGPGITTCVDSDGATSPGSLPTTTGTFVYTVTATSSDGQTGSATIDYTVAGAPTASITSPTTGHTYGVGQVVSTHFSCADPTGPGVTTCVDSDGATSTGALSTTTPGTYVYMVTATSSDGQTGSSTIDYSVAAQPTASITSPTTGHTYGVGQVVPTHFTCADPTGPGITTCVDSDGATSPGSLPTTTGTFVYTVTATSSDGQTGSATISYTVAGAPTASITSPTTGHTYGVGQVVSTHFTCADPTGPGITTCVDSDGSSTPGALSTTTPGTFVYTVTATSSDGQTGTATIDYTVVTHPGIPTASITSPTTGHTYGVGQVVPTHFTCADPTGPGITTCVDSDGATSPGDLSTTTTGTFLYAVTATSSDGQTGSATISYTVAGAPTASIVSPKSGPTSGGTRVTITGTNLQGRRELRLATQPPQISTSSMPSL